MMETVNFVLQHVMKDQMNSRGVALLFPNLDARRRWVVNATLQSL